jgi:hypothetical protein
MMVWPGERDAAAVQGEGRLLFVVAHGHCSGLRVPVRLPRRLRRRRKMRLGVVRWVSARASARPHPGRRTACSRSAQPVAVDVRELVQGVQHVVRRRVAEPAVAGPAHGGRCRAARPGRARSRARGHLLHQVQQQPPPTRQGVQKPQLSCAKKPAKLRTMSSRSRLLVEDHEGAGGGQVLEGQHALKSSGGQGAPAAPETCTAWVSSAPQSASTSATGVPKGTS